MLPQYILITSIVDNMIWRYAVQTSLSHRFRAQHGHITSQPTTHGAHVLRRIDPNDHKCEVPEEPYVRSTCVITDDDPSAPPSHQPQLGEPDQCSLV